RIYSRYVALQIKAIELGLISVGSASTARRCEQQGDA
ncbi:MAG: hypothetical protein QOF90_741, partial [Acetobacteraceae bacterium]|nr:hypothetical protein [Acetobacteraceae bacterium]